MLKNPTMEVAPIIGVVYTDSFDKNHPEAYQFETIGGNNSRTALIELLSEEPDLVSQPCFNSRTVSVYQNLTIEQAHFLAQKHNRATGFTHAMTTQDQVSIQCACRLDHGYLMDKI